MIIRIVVLSCNKRDPFRLFSTNYYAWHCCEDMFMKSGDQTRGTYLVTNTKDWNVRFLPLCFHGREKNDNFLFWSYFSPMSVTVQASSMSFIFTHRCWTIFFRLLRPADSRPPALLIWSATKNSSRKGILSFIRNCTRLNCALKLRNHKPLLFFTVLTKGLLSHSK